MKVLIPLFVLVLVTAQACTSSRSTATVPACIQEKIAAVKKEPKWNPPAEVAEYVYNGQTVYLFSSPCCDQYNVLYDASCRSLCAPSGGFTGKGDGKCADFTTTARLVRTVWRDER